jgi:hypothetical protein
MSKPAHKVCPSHVHWPWGTNERIAHAAAHARAEFDGDEFNRGYGGALALRDHEQARELVLARQAWAWSPERLSAFLLGHEQWMRVARCTCNCCPIHDNHERPSAAGAN